MKSINYIKFTFLPFLALTLLQSCVSKKEMLYMQDVESYNNTEVTYNNHTLQVDDILKISVGALIPEAAIPYNSAPGGNVVANSLDVMKLDGYLVSKTMTINFPVLGELSVKEKTAQDLENDIKKLLVDGGYLINPNVTVRLLNAKVTILGEVKIPGTFSFTENNISLLQALGLAGDLTINGSREDVVVLRSVDGVQTTARINLTSSSWLSGPYQMVKPNDVIIVNPNSAKLKTAGYVGNVSTILGITSLLLSSIILLTR
ncbi:polysaccharide biosynthesis/export family protein [Flavobacteriaceae bacterium]|nr:polysaccharide biosynthesis/export family protein [Flavobacteriaceae bacterium]